MSEVSETPLAAIRSAPVLALAISRIRRAAEVVLAVLMTIAVAAFVGIAIAAALGVHARIEQSGSMAPTLRPGDLLFVESIRPTAARTGDILTFPAPGRSIELTHRAIGIRRLGNQVRFVTRGDANTGVERWSVPASGTIGREVLDVPAVGGAITWLRGAPLVFAIWLTAPFVLLGVLRRIWRTS